MAQVDFKGKLIDAKTGNPVPYVNIGIVDKGIGTVSDEEGLFHLEFDPKRYELDDVILFSSLGYESLEIPVSEVKLVYNEYPTLRLKPAVLELPEVVVTDKRGEFVEENVGYKNTGEPVFGYWKDNIALGGELATHIEVKKGLRQLKSLGFEIWENASDSVLIRVNIYDIGKSWGLPGKNLNTSQENMLYTIAKGEMFAHVDLVPYSIFVRDDFIVSIELLKVYGNIEPKLALAAVSFGNASFRKYASQDKWEKISETGMAFFLETSYLVSEKAAERKRDRTKKRKDKLPMVYGFAIDMGRMIPDVAVRNTRTKEWTTTDNKGRYTIHAKEKDVLIFSKKGYLNIRVEVGKKPDVNVRLRSK